MKSKSNCHHTTFGIIRILVFFGVLHLAKGFIPGTNPVLRQQLIVESRDGFAPKFGADTSSNHRCFIFNFQASREAQASCGTTISGQSPKQEPASQIKEHNDSRVGDITKQAEEHSSTGYIIIKQQPVSQAEEHSSTGDILFSTQNPDILAGHNDSSAGIQNPDILAGTHDPSAGTEEQRASNSRAPVEGSTSQESDRSPTSTI